MGTFRTGTFGHSLFGTGPFGTMRFRDKKFWDNMFLQSSRSSFLFPFQNLDYLDKLVECFDNFYDILLIVVVVEIL